MARSRQLQRILKKFDDIPKAVRVAVQPALLKSGDELAAMMKHLAPKDTGALAESITVTMAGHSTPAYSQPGGSKVVPENAVMVTVGNGAVRYPHLVEYGTADTHAQPYFWPAFRLLKKRVETRIKRALGKAVREEWDK